MTTAARIRVSLDPRQIVHIDSTDNKSINLQCGDRAEMLGLVDNGELVAFDPQQANAPMIWVLFGSLFLCAMAGLGLALGWISLPILSD